MTCLSTSPMPPTSMAFNSDLITAKFNSSRSSSSPNNGTDDSFDYSIDDIELLSLFSGSRQTLPRRIADSLSVVAILANAGSLLAVSHAPGRVSVNLRLIVSLSLSDMLIAVSALAMNHWPQSSSTEWDACLAVSSRSLQNASHIVSLLNLLGLAIDHYLAICRPLEYQARLRPHVAVTMIVAFWLGSLLIGYSDMFYPFGDCSHFLIPNTYCRRVWCSTYDSEYVSIPLAVFILLSMMIMYSLIYRQVYVALH